MKNNSIDFIRKAFSSTLLVIIAATAVFAQEADLGSNERIGGERLVGTWDATVVIRNCSTGDEITSFRSIASFNEGGTTIGSTAGIPQAARTPEHGIWRHIVGRRYIFKFKTYSFDPAGTASGYSVVTHTIELNRFSDAYVSEGNVRFYNMAGVQVGQGCSDAVGTRMEF